jgi:hypothetical protein
MYGVPTQTISWQVLVIAEFSLGFGVIANPGELRTVAH